MTAQPVEAAARRRPLDPNSEAGRLAAERSAVITAGAIERLRREGKPVPSEDTSP